MRLTRHLFKGHAPTDAGELGGLAKVGAGAVVSLVVAAVLVLSPAIGAAALAHGGMTGDPQPELKMFTVNASGGGQGTGAVLADGTLVLAAPSHSDTTINVCMLHPGDRKCAATSTLKAYPGDSFSEPAEVVATGGENVSVVATDCCNIPPSDGGDGYVLAFNSTNDGKSFNPYVEVGNLYAGSVGGATVVDGQIVVVGGDPHLGTVLQAFSPTASSPQTAEANVVPAGDQEDTAVGTYNGGVLVASDDTSNTYVEYAPSGSDFSSTASYHSVTEIKGETTLEISGSALLTDVGGSLTGDVRLRFFNGTSFGSAYKVPQPKNYDDGYFGMQQVGGRVHVFFLDRRAGYDIFGESTTDGVHWSPLQQYGSAIESDSLNPVLGPTGAGLVFADAGTPLKAQPILNSQDVRVALKASRVKVGTGTTLDGTVTPKLNNQGVTLQKLSSGEWYNVATGHESAAGTFSFKVPGTTETYRAVVAYLPGYYEYGYSNSATLTAVKK